MATWGCYIRAAPHQLAPTPPALSSQPQHPQSITMECTDRDRQIYIKHGVKWGCIKTFKPISATTLNIFVKLTYNEALISYINELVVIFRNYFRLPNYEWSNLRFVHRSRLAKKVGNSICRSSVIKKNFKKQHKLVNVRYLGHIIAKLQKNIRSSCWDPFTSCNVPTNSHCQRYSTLLNLIVLRRLWTAVHIILRRC